MDGVGGFLAGAIVGKMILDRTQWQQSVDKVKSDEKTLAGSASRMSSKFAGVGKAMTLAGGAIVGTLGMMVKSYIKAGDEVHKMALRTGFATETLSELRYAAQISGTDLTSLEKAVKKMQKTIVDASEGMTTYQRAFERIGVNYKELQGLHPEQQFEILARAIASVEDPTIRAATAQDIFGRAGTKLLPLFAQGVDGMEALREKARELGMIFDQEAADKAARLADAQATLKGAMQGLTIAIAENIVPVLSKFVEGLSGVISKISDWMKANPFLASTITKVVAVLGGLMTVLGPMLIILPKLVAGLAMMKGAVVALAGPVGILTAALGALAIGYLKVRDAQKKAQEAAERAAQQEDMLFAKMKKAADMAGLTEQEFLKLRDAYNGNAAAMAMAIKRGQEGKKLQEALAKVGKEHAEEIEKQKDATIDYKSAIENALKPMEEMKQKQQSWLDYLKETGIQTLKQKQDRVDELTDIIKDLDTALKDGKISEEDYTEAIIKAREEIELLEGATTTWGKVLEDFGIKTVSEAKQETEYLKSAFSLLQEKLESGEITQEEYNKAVGELEIRLKAATDEVVIMGGQLAVLGQQFDALVPKARDFGSIAADMMLPATKGVGEFKDAVFEEMPKTESKFTEVSQRIKDAWTMGLKDMLSGARSFSDVAGSIWGTIKEQFFTLVAQLVSKWTLGFIGQIVTGSGGLLNSVKSVFGGIGNLLTGAEGGGGGGGLFGNIGGSFLGTIGKMAGPLGIGLLAAKFLDLKQIGKAASETISSALEAVGGVIKGVGKVFESVFGAGANIITGIGNVVGGLGKAIGSLSGLLSQGGKKYEEITYWLKPIAETNQNILNQFVGFFHAKLLHIIDVFHKIHNYTNTTKTIAGGIRDKLNFIAGTKFGQIITSIDKGVSTLDKTLKEIITTIRTVGGSIASAQHGAILTKPQLVMTHGTPSAPEYVLPAAQLNRLMTASSARSQEINIHNEVKITGTIISDREFTRQKLIPEIVKALDINASEMKRKFRRALGVA